VLRAADDLVLELQTAVQEIIAVTRHAHDQVAVLLRVLLGFPQRVGRHHVELDVVPGHLEIRPHERPQIMNPLLVREEVRSELLASMSSVNSG
jgi:hypothetical protein